MFIISVWDRFFPLVHSSNIADKVFDFDQKKLFQLDTEYVTEDWIELKKSNEGK